MDALDVFILLLCFDFVVYIGVSILRDRFKE